MSDTLLAQIMTDTLTDKEMNELGSLGYCIIDSLLCEANGPHMPCRTDRLTAVVDMKRYLEIHGYTVVKNNPITTENQHGF